MIDSGKLIEGIEALKDYFTKNYGLTDYSDYMILTGVKTDLTECLGINVVYDINFPEQCALVTKDYYKVNKVRDAIQKGYDDKL